MRSSFFVLVSIFVHAMCVAAIAVSPGRLSMPEGNHDVEVTVGEPAEQPGVENAPLAQETPPPPPVAEPVKVAKASVRKTRVVKAPMEKVRETELPKKEVPAAAVTDESESKLDPEIAEQGVVTLHPAPVKDSAPTGVEADESDAATEAGTEEKTAEEPEGVDLVQGGATKAGAVSYLDLKQAPGNRSPMYPMGARRENRQGQVELVYRVTKEGSVSDVQVAKSSGHKDLDMEAARAVAMFKFVPGQEGWARHPVAFSLKGATSQAPSKLRNAQAE